MESQTVPFEIAVIGGGISGLVLTIAIQARFKNGPVNVTIYEQAHHFGEIGAGVAFNPASLRAMKLCSPDVYEAYEKVATTNIDPSKKHVWFDFLDAYAQNPVGQERWLFDLTNELGANAVHRAHFLGELVKLVPEGTAKFNKRLDTIEEVPASGRIHLKFHDGSDSEADAVIGCDGIKSRVRAVIYGETHPSTHPVYTHKYAYRGLIPIERAREALGEELANNSKMHMGQDGHVLTFPINQGNTMNVVAFKTNPDQWPSDTKLTLPSKKEHVFEDFADFGPTVHKIIELLDEDLDCWAIFDLGDHPLSTYAQGRLCLLGDAAHATSPHHGSGAGFCVEDAAVMAELLADPHVQAEGLHKYVDAVFKAFDISRRPRSQWLVQSSRRAGDLYEWRAEGVGDDIGKIAKECQESNATLWDAEISDMVDEAKKELRRYM